MLKQIIASGLISSAFGQDSELGHKVDPIPSENCESTEDYEVTCFHDTGYITMDPKKAEHDTTIIYLHGAAMYAWSH